MPKLKLQGRKLCLSGRKLQPCCPSAGPCCSLGFGCSVKETNGTFSVTATATLTGTATIGAYAGSPSAPSYTIGFQYQWSGASSGTFSPSSCSLSLSNGTDFGAGVQSTGFGTTIGPAGATGSITPSVPFYTGSAAGPNSFFASTPATLKLNDSYTADIYVAPDSWVTASGLPLNVNSWWGVRVTVAADGTVTTTPLSTYDAGSTIGLSVAPILDSGCVTGFNYTIQGSVRYAGSPSSWPYTQVAASGKVAFVSGLVGCSTPPATTASCGTVTVDGYFLTTEPGTPPSASPGIVPAIDQGDDPITGGGLLLP